MSGISNYRTGESSGKVFRRVRHDGLELPERPNFHQPQIPADITALDPVEMMELFQEINSWLDYIEVQLAAAIVDEKYEESVLEEIEALERIEAKGNDVTTKKAKVFESQEFINQRDKVQEIYGYRKVVETIFNRLDRGKFIVSRELTRRTGSYGDRNDRS